MIFNLLPKHMCKIGNDLRFHLESAFAFVVKCSLSWMEADRILAQVVWCRVSGTHVLQSSKTVTRKLK